MVDVSIVIACYNAAHALESRVNEFRVLLDKSPWSWEIVIANDGSQDATGRIAERVLREIGKGRYLAHPSNRGRGQAVRDAIPETQGRWVGYVDVDDSTPATYLVPILQALEAGADVAEANRTHHFRLSEFPWIAHRYMAHKVYARLVRYYLGLHGHDTETGFKFFQRDALLRIREISCAPGWFWDTEVIANAHRLGLRVAEIPSLFTRTPGMPSTMRLARDSIRQFQSLRQYARQIGGVSLQRSCCRSARDV